VRRGLRVGYRHILTSLTADGFAIRGYGLYAAHCKPQTIIVWDEESAIDQKCNSLCELSFFCRPTAFYSSFDSSRGPLALCRHQHCTTLKIIALSLDFLAHDALCYFGICYGDVAVCVSVTLMYCAQTTESIIIRPLPHCSPTILVFPYQI